MNKSTLTGRRWPVVLFILIVTTMIASPTVLAVEKQATLADPWVSDQVDAVPGGSGLSIAIDGNNRPHISYYGKETAEAGSLFGLKYAKWNGSAWVIKFVEPVGITDKAETSIALDSEGNPHISYYKMGPRDLKYAHLAEGTQNWVIEFVAETGDVGITNSLRLDSSNLPRIAYWDETKGEVRYARFDGTKWNYSLVEDLTCGAPWEKRVSLGLDSLNRPHVSYHDCGLPSKLKYAKQVSGVWNAVEVQAGNNSGLSSSIEVDNQNHPHIGYRSGDTAGGLRYAYNNGSDWQISPRIDDDFLWGKSASLELDSGRRARIAYTFWGVNDYPEGFPKEFRFVYLAGDQRYNETIETAHPDSINAQIAMAIDGEDKYHVVYWDDVTDRLMYAQRPALDVRRFTFTPLLTKNHIFAP